MATVIHVFEPANEGVPRYVKALATAQAQLGHDVVVVCPDDCALARELQVGACKVKLVRLGRRRVVRLIALTRVVRRLLRSEPMAAIHTHSTVAGYAMLASGSRNRWVHTPHGWASVQRKRLRSLYRAADRRVLKRSRAVMCVSLDEAAEAELEIGASVSPQHVGSAYDPGPREARGATPPPEAYALCVGRISREKGQAPLAEAWSECHGLLDLPLYFVGRIVDNGEALRIEKATQGRVVGEVGDVAAWLRGATLLVQASRLEGLSLALVEAMACGCAIVAAEAGGVEEALVAGPLEAAGVVVRGDVRALVDEASRLFADEARRIEFANAGKVRAQELFSAEALARRCTATYAALRLGSWTTSGDPDAQMSSMR